MPRAKRTLSEVSTNAKTPAAMKPAKKKNTRPTADIASTSDAVDPNAANEGSANTASTKANVPKFVTICRPGWDTVAERENGEDSDEDEADADGWASADEDEDDNDEGFEDLGEVELQDEVSDDKRTVQNVHGPDCICNKPAKDHPDWIWAFTEDGLKLFTEWQIQAQNRDQDGFGVYFYNDFTAYGLTEVMENQLLAFNKEMNKKPPSPFALWSLLESIGMFLIYDLEPWFGGDDSDGMAEIIMMFGTAVLTTLDILRAHELLVPHTASAPAPIPNIGLVLSLFISFVNDWKSIGGDHGIGETYWPRKALQMADEAGIEVRGPFGAEANVADLRAEIEDEEMRSDASDDEVAEAVKAVVARAKKGKKWKPEDDRFDGEVRIWRKWDWKIEFAEFVRRHAKSHGLGHSPGGRLAIGGNGYDITKMSEAQKKRRYF